ncbi:hypothetical protein RHECNPAF_850045 [Rhizobium etli CNPAF512]|nr:hypothetical protein RHECNPAF_850045 [Rhizobium etli CNPAF512]
MDVDRIRLLFVFNHGRALATNFNLFLTGMPLIHPKTPRCSQWEPTFQHTLRTPIVITMQF